MRPLNVAFDRRAAPADLRRRLHEARALGARSVFVLAGDGVDWPAEVIDPWLQDLGVPVFGGVFPEVVHGTTNTAHGLVTVALADAPDIAVVPHLDRADADFGAALRALDHTAPGLLVLVDGLAPFIARFIEAVFDNFGGGPSFIGGGAGSLSFTPRPCLFTPEGMRAQAALVAALPRPLGIGAGHGWATLEGPFLATQTQGNRIERLDHRPAAEVYRACVEPLLGCALNADNFFEHAKGFPFGLARPDGSVLVRDPIQLDGSTLVCVGEVPPLAAVHVLRGAPRPLVDAARRAAVQAVDALPTAPDGALLIDCISRVLYLGERFGEELEAVERVLRSRGGASVQPPFGALTLGEIANNGRHCLEFYNKTCVVGAFGRGEPPCPSPVAPR